MKPFNLEEYLKDPSRRIITRNGRDVRILCTDRLTEYYPICALVNINGHEDYCAYTADGKFANGYSTVAEGHKYDLFFAPVKKEGWINIYKNYVGATIYPSKDIAFNSRIMSNYITTVKIEWEE